MKAPALIRKRRRTREGRLARELQREREAREVAEGRARNLEALLALPQPLRVHDPGVLGAVAYRAYCHSVFDVDALQAELSWSDLSGETREIWTSTATAVVDHLRRYGRAEG